jgi:hypothetical protein
VAFKGVDCILKLAFSPHNYKPGSRRAKEYIRSKAMSYKYLYQESKTMNTLMDVVLDKYAKRVRKNKLIHRFDKEELLRTPNVLATYKQPQSTGSGAAFDEMYGLDLLSLAAEVIGSDIYNPEMFDIDNYPTLFADSPANRPRKPASKQVVDVRPHVAYTCRRLTGLHWQQ